MYDVINFLLVKDDAVVEAVAGTLEDRHQNTRVRTVWIQARILYTYFSASFLFLLPPFFELDIPF